MVLADFWIPVPEVAPGAELRFQAHVGCAGELEGLLGPYAHRAGHFRTLEDARYATGVMVPPPPYVPRSCTRCTAWRGTGISHGGCAREAGCGPHLGRFKPVAPRLGASGMEHGTETTRDG